MTGIEFLAGKGCFFSSLPPPDWAPLTLLFNEYQGFFPWE